MIPTVFPPDLTETILKEHDLSMDAAGFADKMEEQKARSKKHGKFSAAADSRRLFYAILEEAGESRFVGYGQISCQGKLVGTVEQGDEKALIFEKTPFYPEGGRTGRGSG